MSRSRSIIAVSVLLFGGLATGCSQDGKRTEAAPGSETSAAQSNCRHLDSALQWHAGVREFLQKAIDANSTCTGAAPAGARKVAIFDWDNTVMKNDVGDATMFWMLRSGKVRQPPQRDWRTTSPYLTAEAQAALAGACGPLAEPGQPLPTASSEACATEIVTIYTKAKTVAGQPAFQGWDHRRMEAAYAWASQLQAGSTEAESRQFAEQALTENLAAPVGAKQKVRVSSGFLGSFFDLILGNAAASATVVMVAA